MIPRSAARPRTAAARSSNLTPSLAPNSLTLKQSHTRTVTLKMTITMKVSGLILIPPWVEVFASRRACRFSGGPFSNKKTSSTAFPNCQANLKTSARVGSYLAFSTA
jgi:hypothetical protein